MCKKAEAQFNVIIDEYGKFLSQTIIRLCPKDMGLEFNDIELEARLRILNALQSEIEIQHPASFLYRIASTAMLDAVRRVKAKREEQLRLPDAEKEEEGAPHELSTDPKYSPEMEAERKQLISK